jgi:hypothetical protein
MGGNKLGDLGTIERIILKWMDWTSLVQDKEQWQFPVNTVMNFRIPYKA